MADDHRQGELFPQLRRQAPTSKTRRIRRPASPQDAGAAESGNAPIRQPVVDPSTVLRFPVRAWAPRLWHSRVEHVARVLQERKTAKGRDNFWSRETASLFSKMTRRGATRSEADAEIADFHAAVSWALSDQQSDPGAA